MSKHNFADLNIPYTGAGTASASRLAPILSEAHRLGYTAVALNYKTQTPLKAKDVCNNLPIPLSGAAAKAATTDVVSALAARYDDSITRSSRKSLKRSRGEISKSEPAGAARAFIQLTRITVDVPSSRMCSDIYPASPILTSYDIVAVTPGDEAVAKHAVESGIVDLLSLDLSAGKLPFMLTKSFVEYVVAKDVYFEIDYAPAIRDPTCRRFFIANCLQLLRFTRGRNLIVTSAADHPLELRTPMDVAAIVRLAGLDEASAFEAMSTTVGSLMQRAERRRTSGPIVHVSAPQTLPKTEFRVFKQVKASDAAAGDGSTPDMLPVGDAESAAKRPRNDKAKPSQSRIVDAILSTKKPGKDGSTPSSAPAWSSTPAARGVVARKGEKDKSKVEWVL